MVGDYLRNTGIIANANKYSKTNTNTIGGFDDWGRFEDGPIPLQIQVEI